MREVHKMEIKNVCVIGAGLMGSGITQVCAQAGYNVAMHDIEQKFVDNGMSIIHIRPYRWQNISLTMILN